MTGFVLLRVRAHRLLLAAAALTVVLTTSALAVFTAFTGAIGDAALRRTLEHQAADRSTVEVHADVGGTDPGPLDAAVRKQLTGSFAGLPAKVFSSTQSGPYGLPFSLRPANALKTTDPDLTLLASFDRSRMTLVSGTWPAAAAKGSGEVQVAMPQAAAQPLKITPGRAVTLADRLGGPPLRIRVTGVFRPADPASPYWHLDPLDGRGVHTLAFTTYGPLLVDGGTFASGRVAAANMAWQAAGDFRGATTSRMGSIEQSVNQTLENLHDDEATAQTQSQSSLPDLLEALRRSMLVTRSTLLIGALQLVILAGFALLLVAQLLTEERAGETSLLRARGGSRARVGRLAVVEALLLAVPAAVIAPLLAGPVTNLLAGTGAMARTGVSLSGAGGASAWLVALCAALACAFAVVTPALRSGGSFAARGRRGAVPGVLQAGGDIALLVLAGVAFWQLRQRASGGGALSATTGGTLGIDPVLVAAPALCLLAGTVLVLRVLPLVAKLGERRAARGRGLALALAGWQLARRPRRGAGAALLLVLAVAMGMFAIGQGASWDRSQHDQADFSVGSDLRVTGMTTPPFGQAGIFASVPGITAAAPANRQELLLTQQRHATALIIDAQRAGQAMHFRSDLTEGRTTADLMKPLYAGVGQHDDGVTLPEDTRQVTFTATLKVTAAKTGRPLAEPVTDHLLATVTDAEGIDYQAAVGDILGDGLPHPVTLDLAAQAGPHGSAAGPLRITALNLVYDVPSAQAENGALTLRDARVTGAEGATKPLTVPAGREWTVDSNFDDLSMGNQPGKVGPSSSEPQIGGPTVLALRYATGNVTFTPQYPWSSVPSVSVHMQAPTPPAPALAGIATDSYLKAVDAKVGDRVQVQLNGVDTFVKITAAVKAMPGTGDDVYNVQPSGTAVAGDDESKSAGALLLDLRAVDAVLKANGGLTLEPSEWWLAVRPGDSAKVAAALRSRTDVDTVMVRDESADELRADPLGAGPQSALPAAVIAAAVLAAVGFAVSAVGAIRERNGEFAVLRALGAPRRKLARMIAAEQGLLVVISLIVGVVLGALLTRLVTPLIVLTSQATRPVPDLRVEMPVGPLAQLLAVVLIVPLLVVLATALRRGDPASALRRQGED
ncbi:ABC transporter permease [Actinacidiphila acidipaludis]|uniref:FtsX-like permease family protein n=1 Tax=Actinacidiphila acidipaludis TaxID=2873382 RepID=A0ABS7QMA9_9ACTN|nr:ABC transporter permease [Streptomyces acidipaludis]MBY8882929.1 FtsX-like permease family protein [Streptomyces acidipaludis]